MPLKSSPPKASGKNNSPTTPAKTGCAKPSELCPPSPAASSNALTLIKAKQVVDQPPRAAAALQRFLKSTNLTADDIRRAPSLNFLGKRGEVIAAMRYSRHPAILSFLAVWDDTPFRDRKQIPLSAIALKAQVDISELIGAYLLSFRSLQQQKSALAAMASHPEVVESTIEFAKRPSGYADRRMLHEAVGFVATPRGLSITQNFAQALQPESMPEEEEKVETATAPDIEDIFPQINEREEGWQSTRQKLLEETN